MFLGKEPKFESSSATSDEILRVYSRDLTGDGYALVRLSPGATIE